MLLPMMQDPLRGSTNSKSMVIELFVMVLTSDHNSHYNIVFCLTFCVHLIDAYSLTISFGNSTVPPDFRDSEMPGNMSLVLSQSTSLVCDVTGSPTPAITWYKDGTPVGEIPLNKLIFNELNNLYSVQNVYIDFMFKTLIRSLRFFLEPV